MTNKELSQTIRTELKKNGYTSKDYSIRVKDCGWSTSVHIEIKNPAVSRREIERVALRYENIDRDYMTGEILEGGNTYIRTSYKIDIFCEVSRAYSQQANRIIDTLKAKETFPITDGLHAINDRGNLVLFQSAQTGRGGFRFLGTDDLAQLLYKFYTFGDIAA